MESGTENCIECQIKTQGSQLVHTLIQLKALIQSVHTLIQ